LPDIIKIGQYQLKSQVLLAPMAGTSDKPFRMLCKAQGAALTTSRGFGNIDFILKFCLN
jgi:tRNA-dihydrouridine synthase